MNYYYDIVLNFDMDHIWEFYEWEKTDLFVYVKKIPLFRVSFETIIDFLSYHITIDQDFLKLIKDKTVIRNQEDGFSYAFLMSDSKNSVAVLLNEKGNVIAISKVLVQDDNNINEFMYTLKETEISYQLGKKREKKQGLRQEVSLKQFIQIELSTLVKENNIQKLKYLYYEWTGREEENLDKMYNNMVSLLKTSSSEELEKISYFIRLSYHQV